MDKLMTFGEHLEELRKRLKHAAYAAKKVAQVDGHELSISYE